MTSPSDGWANDGELGELGDDQTRLAFGGSAVVNDAFARLKDELERLLRESVEAAQEADRQAQAARHEVERGRAQLAATREVLAVALASRDAIQAVLNARTMLLEEAVSLASSLVDLPRDAEGYDALRQAAAKLFRAVSEQR